MDQKLVQAMGKLNFQLFMELEEHKEQLADLQQDLAERDATIDRYRNQLLELTDTQEENQKLLLEIASKVPASDDQTNHLDVIKRQEKTIEMLELEMIELDAGYDRRIIELKKEIEGLQNTIHTLEHKNEQLADSKYAKFAPRKVDTPINTGTDSLTERLHTMLQSWPTGIKVRSIAMSMGISVNVANDLLTTLESSG
ncbi:MAG: hypothetical protein ACXAE3_16975 [Candidatus Kariarchaeaceae archaeon]|jgi:chromosome segregation ATPase